MSKPSVPRLCCNPYLFQLLKRMIEYEITDTLEVEPTLKQVSDFIKSSPILIAGEPNNNTVEEHVRAFIWNNRPFCFVEKYLDALARSITKLGKFKDWKDFVAQYENKKFARLAAAYSDKIEVVHRTKKQTFVDAISADELKLIQTWVERDLEVIRRRRRQEGYIDSIKHNLLVEDELDYHRIDPLSDYRFRRVTLKDVDRIANLARRVYPCPINDFDVKKNWFAKNSNIFVICEDDTHELMANLNLLPIKEKFYNELKAGKIYENEITADDIYGEDESHLAKFIYIEGLASISPYALGELRTVFKQAIQELSKADPNSIVISAIGGSMEGDAIMLRHGFKRTGTAVDNRTNVSYPFFEISFVDLLAKIQKRIEKASL